MLKPCRSYEEACRIFRWRIPETYNLAFDVCDRQTMAGADGHRTALVIEQADGEVERYTFHMLRLLSNRLANVLAAQGVRPGDRVALCLGASVEAAVGVLAVTKMGAVAVPVSATLGVEPVAWRLADSQAVAAIADAASAATVMAARGAVPSLAAVFSAADPIEGTLDMWAAMEAASDGFAPALTAADDPAFVFYPTDSFGKPPGVVHAHRVLLGNLPPIEFSLGFFPQFGDIMWAAGDWMCFQTLVWNLLPAWHHGLVAVAGAWRPDPVRDLGLLARHGVRTAVLGNTQLMALVQAAATIPHPQLRALAVGPEPLTERWHEQVRRVMGLTANEIWGSPETGAVAANNAEIMELRAGSPGRASPGVTVEAVDETGRVVRPDQKGMLAVAPGAPGAFLAHTDDAAPGRLRLPNGWLMTGRLGSRDLDGWLWPDPLPETEGAATLPDGRVQLEEVAAALVAHPRVVAAHVITIKGELKAFVVPDPELGGDLELAMDLQTWVGKRRGEGEVPRRIEFVKALPDQ